MFRLDSSAAATVANVNAVPKDNFSHKFTTSNFTETSIVVNSDAVFGGSDSKSTNHTTSNMPNVKKRKMDSVKSSNIDDINK